MASVRKRTWTSKGVRNQAWVADYADAGGVRRSRQFKLKKEAEEFLVTVATELRDGVHVAAGASPTVREAAAKWIARCEREGLEDLTIEDYLRHVDKRILPHLGAVRLSALSPPRVQKFVDDLHDEVGRDMAGRVLKSLKAILSNAVRLGLAGTNAAMSAKVARRAREESRVVLPSREEMRSLARAAEGSAIGWALSFVLMAMFCGLRASELRGIAWSDLDLRAGRLSVRRRADRKNRLGEVKSGAARRSVPMPASLVKALRQWKPSCPAGVHDLVFPTSTGSISDYGNIIERMFAPLLVEAGLTKDGKARYGLHALRHYAASVWIHTGVPLKRLQVWMGHADVRLTLNLYGHLFEEPENDAAVAARVEAQVVDKSGRAKGPGRPGAAARGSSKAAGASRGRRPKGRRDGGEHADDDDDDGDEVDGKKK